MITFLKDTFTTPSMQMVKPRNVAASILANHFAGSFVWMFLTPVMFYSGISLFWCAIIVSALWFFIVETPQYRKLKPAIDILYDAGAFISGVFFAMSLWTNTYGDAITSALLTFIIAQSAFNIKKETN